MPKKLLLVDNYDSFTYNLVQYFEMLGVEVTVKRNDKISLLEAQRMNPDFLVFSPGPGTVENPSDIGIGESLFREFQGKIPILGVCLGHQMIGKIFGGKIKKVPPQHGKRWDIRVIKRSGLFREFPDTFEGMRYHSMVVEFPADQKNLNGLEVTAKTDDKDEFIMALENQKERIFGVQFHPESIGTESGIEILRNFLEAG